MKKINFLKFIIYLIVSFMFFLTFSLSVHAAAVPLDMPILPYVPPTDDQLFDILSNSYGVTAPDISDKTQKLQAYWDLYRQGLGASYETVKAELEQRFNSAKTSGQLFIPASLGSSIQEALTYALNNGYTTGETAAITDFTVLKQNIINDFQITTTEIKESNWNALEINLQAKFGNTPYSCIGIRYAGNLNYNYLNLIFYPADLTMKKVHNVTYNNTTYQTAIFPNGVPQNYTCYVAYTRYGRTDYYQGNANLNFYSSDTISSSNIILYKDYGKVASVTNVQAQSQEITAALSTESVKPVTADTNANENTGSFTITLPNIIIYPATSVSDLEAKQEQLGVIPTTPDTTAEQLQQIINELQQSKSASLGDIPTYSIDLTEYFPFCIPFDIGNILTILIAEPEAPSFDWEFPSGYENGEVQYTTVNIDLSVWDPVAAVLRAGLILVFIIGLGMVTRSVFLRG